MNKFRRKVVVVYGIGLVLVIFAGISKGRSRGESAGQAVVTLLIASAIWLAVVAAVIWYGKRNGSDEGDAARWDELRPGEGAQPPGWWWDDRSHRWRKPPRSGT